MTDRIGGREDERGTTGWATAAGTRTKGQPGGIFPHVHEEFVRNPRGRASVHCVIGPACRGLNPFCGPSPLWAELLPFWGVSAATHERRRHVGDLTVPVRRPKDSGGCVALIELEHHHLPRGMPAAAGGRDRQAPGRPLSRVSGARLRPARLPGQSAGRDCLVSTARRLANETLLRLRLARLPHMAPSGAVVRARRNSAGCGHLFRHPQAASRPDVSAQRNRTSAPLSARLCDPRTGVRDVGGEKRLSKPTPARWNSTPATPP